MKGEIGGRMFMRLILLVLLMPSLGLAQTYVKEDFKTILVDSEAVKSFDFVPCTERDLNHKVTQNTRLNPNCTYQGMFAIKHSNVTLDCRGATIKSPGYHVSSYGIMIYKDTQGEPVTNVTIRNCRLDGWGIVVRNYNGDETRALTKLVPGGVQYDKYQDPGIEVLERPNYRLINNLIYDSKDSGVYVHRFVEGVLIKDSIIAGASQSGIYLDGYAAQNKIVGNKILANGYQHNPEHKMVPGGVIEYQDGQKVRIRYTGREGLSIDASNNNYVANNFFKGNASGGILFYKNNSEYPNQAPDQWFLRKWGSFENRIVNNRFVYVPNGVPSVGIWVGSRMSLNQKEMYHSEPAYLKQKWCVYKVLWWCVKHDIAYYHQDSAKNNKIVGNTLINYPTAILVEDDLNYVASNRIHWSKAGFQKRYTAISVQAPVRTAYLSKPVKGTRLARNSVTLGAGTDWSCPPPSTDPEDRGIMPPCTAFAPYKLHGTTVSQGENTFLGNLTKFVSERISYNYGPYLFTNDVDILL